MQSQQPENNTPVGVSRINCKRASCAILAALVVTIVLWFGTFPFRKDFIEVVPGVRLEPARPYMAEKDFAPGSAYALLKEFYGWTFYWDQKMDESKGDWLSGEEQQQLSADFERLTTNVWSDQSYSNLLAIMQKSQDKIALANRVILAPNPQIPSPPPDATAMILVPLQRQGLNTAKILQASAIRKASLGDIKGAFDDVKTSLLFLGICTRGGTLIPHMVNQVNLRLCGRTLRRIALSEKVPADITKNMIQNLLDIDRNMEPMAEALRYELKLGNRILEDFFSPRTSMNMAKMLVYRNMYYATGLDPQKQPVTSKVLLYASVRFWAPLTCNSKQDLVRNRNNLWAHIINACENPYSAKGMVYPPEIDSPSPLWKTILTRRGYFFPIIPMFADQIIRQAECHAQLRSSAIVLAIRSFQQEKNRLPASLAELVPDFLASVPEDPFDQAPFRYKVNPDGSWKVYCVGANGVDDGGIPFNEHGNICCYDRATAVDLVFSSTDVYAPAAKPPCDSALIAYYPFNGNANDASGNGNSGILHGTKSATGRLDDSNGSLDFNGTSDYVEVPDTPLLSFNQPITTAAWICPESTRSGGIIGQWGYGGLAGDAFMLSMNSAHLHLTLPIPGLYNLRSSTTLPTGTWSFVAMTYDGAVARLYVNGKMDVSGNITVPQVDSSQSLKMGLEDIFYGAKNYFRGRMSSVYLYNRVLSDSEVGELYRRGTDHPR